MVPRRITPPAARATLTVGVAVAVLLGAAGCGGSPSPSATPVVVRLADIQSGTLRVRLDQVIKIETPDPSERYSALIADETIVTVVVRRDPVSGHFDPEIVPHRVGTTQVALVGRSPLDTTGFKVIVSP
jgi:hypothetical protein